MAKEYKLRRIGHKAQLLILKYIAAGLYILCLTGCVSIPFQKTALVPVELFDPADVRQQFAGSLPSEFQLVTTIEFMYKRHSIPSAIGYIAADIKNKSFTVVGINPIGGCTLFELSMEKDRVDCRFAIEEFTRHRDFANTVADNIKKAYFDCIPAADADVFKKKHTIIFRQPKVSGTMEYVFAGADKVLIEKNYYENNRRVWSVFYYEYQKVNEKLYPAGIIINHYQYEYNLVVRLLEIRA
ncbi:MAG: hypothetical protein KJ550_04780 [Proteobacteria bacterium]|nr:hypothetical protein [Desulfobacteraceae bacterium]MBU4012763.1 hypothetical protein [Pseudomonadota bacterium]MBU4127851.1 hypothetical protein [Pseudomonadota bacterium]